ncbi:MAG: hypothetical protein K8H86_10090 [Ignavibacteriaceae bacterium]|nr:hypothetical protein [Ignavibacteriaceae bacterium]
MTENEISHQIIGDVVELYKHLGIDMLINFNTVKLKDGIHRIVNNL